MNITEHEMKGLLTGKCIPGDMRVNEELPAYLVRKFDALQQQVAALAAENSLVSDSLSSVMRGVYRAKTYLDSNRFIDADSAILTAIEAGQRKNEAPNTDAVIREIRAQAVESYANYSDECYGTHDKSGEDARVYAARILSGEQP